MLSEKPDSKSINLEFLEIEDFGELVPLLAQFQNLEEILLFGNRIGSLPHDLSELQFIKYLDLSNNLIKSVDDILDGLKSLPSLTHLSITLQDETESAVLAENLASLEFLNGEEITLPREAASE
jgi:Leucine-rich repeat (LRR) protein